MYKLLLLLFLLPLAVTANDKDGKYTKTKTIKKEFSVSQNATLNVVNKYGNIDIVTWNDDKIVMDITITTNGNDEEKVENRLEQIDVKFDASSSNVSAKTIIEKNAKSWSFWGKKNNVSIEINYKIKMPVTNNVDLTMDYGGINLDKLEGSSKIDCDYGKINIGELLNTDNHINVDYTNNSNIEFMKDGTIDADYSTIHIEKAGGVHLNADYSHLSFGSVADLEYNCDYGSLEVESAENLKGSCDYMHTAVGSLDGSGEFDIDYGSLKIKKLASNFKILNVQSSYTHVKLGLNPNASFDITANLSYTGFKKSDGFTFKKEIVKSSKKYYEGYYNSANSGSKVILKSSYGSVSFKNN